MMRIEPDWIRNSPVLQRLLQVYGTEMDGFSAWVGEVLRQLFVRDKDGVVSMSWGLPNMEETLSLPYGGNMTDQERADRIVAKLRSFRQATPFVIQLVANSFANGQVSAIEDFAGRRLIVRFIDVRGVPPNLGDLKAALERLVRVSVILEFVPTYLTWGELLQAGPTWNDLKLAGITWDQLRLMRPDQLPVGAARTFGVLTTDDALSPDSSHDADEYANGFRTKTVFLPWRDMEPTKGGYTGWTTVNARLAALRAQGYKIVLGFATHNPPSWLYTDAETAAFAHWKNQLTHNRSTVSGGTLTRDDQGANLVFSQVIRDKIAAFVSAAATNLTGPFAYIRPPASVFGEWSYPHPVDGNDYWAYDAAAQGGAGRPTTIPACPVPGWTPGTGTTTQAGNFLTWYLNAMADAQRWSLDTVGLYFPGVPQVILMPSFGIRASTNDVTNNVATRLDGTAAQSSEVRAGVDFAGQLAALAGSPPAHALLATLWPYSTWTDCPYGAWMGNPTGAMNPYEFIVSLANTNGFSHYGGEGTGDQGMPAFIREATRHQRQDADLIIYAFERNLYDGRPDASEWSDFMRIIDPTRSRNEMETGRAIEAGGAARRATQWAARVRVGEYGAPVADSNWQHLLQEMQHQYDALGFDSVAWAAFPDHNVNALAVYQQVSGGASWTVGEASAAAPFIEHTPPTGVTHAVSLPGGEFGSEPTFAAPGTLNTAYGYPTSATYAYLATRGVTEVRIPFKVERLLTSQAGTALRTTEAAALRTSILAAAANGMKVMLDMHNFGRCDGAAQVLNAGWTIAQHNQAWATIIAWILADTTMAATVTSLSHNEPHDFASVAGAFTPTYTDDFSASLLGWTAGGPSGAAVAGNATAPGYAHFTVTTDGGYNEMFIERNNATGSGTGSALHARVRPVTIPATGTLQGFLSYQVGGGWVNGPVVDLTAVGAGNWVELGPWDTGASTGFTNFRVCVKNDAGAAGQACAFDVDYWERGNLAGALTAAQVCESVFNSWVTACRAASWVNWLWWPAYEWSSMYNFTVNHPGSVRPWTDPLNKTGVELHQYYDTDRSGTYPDSFQTVLQALAGY